jgi:MFS family permease
MNSSPIRKLLSHGLGRDRILIVVSAFFFYFTYNISRSILPLHIISLDGSDAIVGRIVGVTNGATLAARWITGGLQDKYGSKKFLVGSALCLACVTLSYRFISSISLLTVSAFFQGIAFGGFATAAVGQMIEGLHSEIDRTSALSIFSMSRLTAASIAPALALAMATHTETSAILGWAALGGFAAAVPTSRVSLELLDAKTQTRHTNPTSSRVNVFRDRGFVGSSLCYLMWSVSYGAIYSFLPLYGQQRGIMNVGMFFTTFAMVNLFSRVLVKPLVLRIGTPKLIGVSSVLVIMSMFVLSMAKSPFHLVTAGVLYGLGSTSMYPCLTALATGRGSGNTGLTIALFMSNFEVGQMIGSIILGNIIAGRGYPAVYRISGIAMLVGILIFNRMVEPVRVENLEAES